jgi:hypothetical protein
MYGILLSTVCAVAVLFYFIVWPVVRYYLDPKGLRRYPNLTWFAGISNIPFMIEANRGFRSRRLAELHIVHPVVRIGPNSLSYGDAQAVKVCLAVDAASNYMLS